MRAGTHRDRTPEETPHGGRKPPKNQEGAGAGTKARRKRAPRQTPRPTPRKGIPRRGDQHRPTPTERPTTPGGAPPNTPQKQASDAVRITPAHTHQPPETTRGMEGTPTRGKRATPTEEAAGNAAARRTTTPSPPGNDPGRHKGHLTGTRRGRRHGHSDQDWGPKPPEDTGPRHRPPGRATPRTVTRSTYPTHQRERHAQAPTARTQQDTHT